MKYLRFHKIVYALLRIILLPFLTLRFRFRYEKAKIKNNPYIVLANHNTNWDPLLVALSFPKQMYFVASDHIFRWGIISKIIRFLVSPIARIKATPDPRTVMDIFGAVKKGANVCIFAEGNCSFFGETGYISPATGKMVKRSGAALITYRLDGGYFTSPRWSKTIRRGAMHGAPVAEYSPKQLSQMTDDEVNSIIQRDLYVNAYETQRENPVAYKGRKKAEHLETIFYLCPKCGSFSSIISRRNEFSCPCGFAASYTSFGSLESSTKEPLEFSTIIDWGKWQNEMLNRKTDFFHALSPDIPIISDEDQTIFSVIRAKSNIALSSGRLCLYNDRLTLETEQNDTLVFPISEISDMAILQQMDLIFFTAGKCYEVKSPYPRSALKYLHLYNLLQKKILLNV